MGDEECSLDRMRIMIIQLRMTSPRLLGATAKSLGIPEHWQTTTVGVISGCEQEAKMKRLEANSMDVLTPIKGDPI